MNGEPEPELLDPSQAESAPLEVQITQKMMNDEIPLNRVRVSLHTRSTSLGPSSLPNMISSFQHILLLVRIESDNF